MKQGPTWQLVRGDELLAELVMTGGDFAWLNAEVWPVAGFAEIRPLCDDELRQLDLFDDYPEPWESAYRGIREAVPLLAPDGGQCLSSAPHPGRRGLVAVE
jgi:hypothetical protein